MNFDRAYQEIKDSGQSRFAVGGSLYSASLAADRSLQVTTLVYQNGDAYLPRSVRQAVMGTAIGTNIPLSIRFTIAEEDGMVLMHLGCQWNPRSSKSFASQIAEFVFLSEEWRHHLNDQGKKDLLPVHAR